MAFRSRRHIAERWFPRIGAALFALTILFGLSEALATTIRIWKLALLDQSGQSTIYNSKREGGTLGMPVELGDLDGDGKVDAIIAPMNASGGPNSERTASGEIYVYPGDASIGGVFAREDHETPPGLTIWGARAGDTVGTEIFVADIDGDAIEDLLIGSQNYDGPANDRDNAGGAWIVFGQEGLLDSPRTIDLSLSPDALAETGIRVVRISGHQPGGRLGIWIEAGDLDADGKSDLILGTDQFDQGDRQLVGKVDVLYGRATFPSDIDMDVFDEDVSTIIGRDALDHFGASLHARDLDADGRAELIVGAALNRLSAGFSGSSAEDSFAAGGGDGPDNSRRNCGETYVFFAPEGDRLPRHMDLSEALPASMEGRVTTIYGDDNGEYAGEELTTGDFNGDGLNDLVLGALGANGMFASTSFSGRAYVVYWQPSLMGTEIDLSSTPDIPRPEGLRISTLFGRRIADILGDTLSAADFDRDGFDDLAVGIPHAAPDAKVEAGRVALVFGRQDYWPEGWQPDGNDVPVSLRISIVDGHRAGDLMSYSMEARDYDNDGYADLYPNAMRGERNGRDTENNEGAAYVVSGYELAGLSVSLTSVIPPIAPSNKPAEVELVGDGATSAADTRVWLDGVEAEVLEVIDRFRIRVRLPILPNKGPLDVRIVNRYGEAMLPSGFEYGEGVSFLRADVDRNESIDISDPIAILGYLYLGTSIACLDAADADDDGRIFLNDAVYILNFLFRDGPAPKDPFPAAGIDETADALGCDV